ncbi:MFS transporter [Streptomyces poriferorum]|uniref:MFS transporter n=1 Tax=Streptomyces poriferorum TaxID=2798799 RepID=UPI00273F741D|nr:MFS transporter [Streptomyces sp. Alt1]WLQ51656.1 MFS transporter [Streptomyces sp. Alt1]
MTTDLPAQEPSASLGADTGPPPVKDLAAIRRTTRMFYGISYVGYFIDFTWAATSILYFASIGLSPGAIFATVAVVWLAEAVFEIPTGLVADLLGRRSSVIASFVFRAVGFGALFFAHDLPVLLLAHVLVSIGTTFESGALEAWAVDESEHFGADETVDALFTRSRIACNSGLISGVLTGAVIGTRSLALPFLLSAVVCAVTAAVLPLVMREHSRAPRPGGLSLSTALRENLGGTGAALRGDRVLMFLAGAVAFVALMSSLPGVQWTAYLDGEFTTSLVLIGLVRCVGPLVQIPLLDLVRRLRTKRGVARPPIVLAASFAAAVLLLGTAFSNGAWQAVTLFACFSAASGVAVPVVQGAVNDRLTSANRATMLSFVSLVSGAVTGVGLFVVGWFVGAIDSVTVTWSVAAAGLAAGGALTAWLCGGRR